MNQEEKDNYVMLLEFELDVVGGNGYLNGTSWWFYGVCLDCILCSAWCRSTWF
jgi:hypothetical protein